jgi:hypothetical protein
VYLTSPQLVDDHPNLLRDVNDAQAQVARLWKQGDARAVQAMHEVTSLSPEIIADAFGRTSPLSGLDNGTVETLLAQMRFDRQYGTLLQSDVWTQDSEWLRLDMFARMA